MDINRDTYEQYFLLYVDNELSAAERREVERFVALHPDLKSELELLQQAVLEPEETLVYPNKEELLRGGKQKKAGVFPLIRWAAAAAILVIGLWLFFNNKHDRLPQSPGIARTEPPQIDEPPQNPEPGENKVDPSTPQAGSAPEEPALQKEPSLAIRSVPLTVREVTTNGDKIPAEPSAITTLPDASTGHPEKGEDPLHRSVNIELIEEPPTGVAVAVVPAEPPQAEGNPAANIYPAEEFTADDEVIYVANTSIPKRNKFRGVFRQASRFIDRVTAIQ